MSDTQIPSLNLACRLLVNGVSVRVGQICRGALVLDSEVDLPPSEAELIVQVDGKRKVHRIFLPHGIQRNVESTPFY
jgi:hypothetical protein